MFEIMEEPGNKILFFFSSVFVRFLGGTELQTVNFNQLLLNNKVNKTCYDICSCNYMMF